MDAMLHNCRATCTEYVAMRAALQKYSPTAGVHVVIFSIDIRVAKYTLYDMRSILLS